MRPAFKRLIFTASFCALFACSQNSQQSIFSHPKVNTGTVLANIGSTQIREGLLDTLGEMSPRLKDQIRNPIMKKKILDSLIDQQLLYQEAVKRGLDQDGMVTLKAMLNYHSIVANSLLENELESEMKRIYEEKKGSDFTKLSISQIGIYFADGEKDKKDDKTADSAQSMPTEEQKQAALQKIKDIKTRLSAGEDFEKVATEVSEDKRTNKRGGKAGQISKNDKRYERFGLTPLVEAAFTLKVGDISEPIETKEGYYLIKVTEGPTVTDFEDAKRVLGFELQSHVRSDLLAKLKKDAKIERFDEAKKEKTGTATQGPVTTPATTEQPAPVQSAAPMQTEPPAQDEHAHNHDHDQHEHDADSGSPSP